MNKLKAEHPILNKYHPSNYAPPVYNFTSQKLIEYKPLENDSSLVQNLEHMAKYVNKAINFKQTEIGKSSLDKEVIDTRSETDCYGCTIALSQLLEKHDINHKIAFSNTHAFIIAFDKYSDSQKYPSAYLADALSPVITGNIGSSSICHTACINKGIFGFSPKEYLRSIGINGDKKDRLLDTRPWLKTEADIYQQHNADTPSTMYIKLFDKEQGIKMLYAYDELRYTLQANDTNKPNATKYPLSRAYHLSKFISNQYPEMDLRVSPAPYKRLIKQLGDIGLSTLASRTIDRLTDSRIIEEGNDTYHRLLQSDEYYNLGIRIQNKDLIFKSLHILTDLNKKHHEITSSFTKHLITKKLSKVNTTLGIS